MSKKKINKECFLCGLFFKVFIKFRTILLLYYVFFFWLVGTWDLSSLAED